MNICVWPQREVSGFSDPTSQVEKFPTKPWKEALLTRYPTDAHATCYFVEGEEEVPRLNTSSHQYLIESGKEPRVQWLFLDIDNPGHKPWTNREEKQRAMDELATNPLLEDAGIYTTRAGYRLLWRLDKPVLARHWKSFYNQFRKYMIEQGIPADTSETLAAWPTGFRLPYVTRDGEALDPSVDFTPLTDGYTLKWIPPARLRTEVGSPTAAIDDTKREVVPPTREEWRHLIGASLAGQYVHKLETGIPLGKPGNRDSALMEVIASLGGYLKATDPNQIYRFIHRSVSAD